METQKHIVAYQELFDLMANEHDLILLQSEMDEIIIASQNVVKKYDLLAESRLNFKSHSVSREIIHIG
jgi:hypothetical protein